MAEITADDLAQGRLTKVFKFLKELNELRNPVPRDMSGYSVVLRIDTWPRHPCVEVFRGDQVEDDNASDSDDDAKVIPLIRIKRAQLTSCPKPPEILGGWLKPGWQDVEGEPEVLTIRNIPDKEKESISVAFSDDQDRVAKFEVWKAIRAKWVEGERPAVAARQLFEQIHALWTALQREGDRMELALADGMLSVPDQLIHHPVLSQRISLEFDATSPEFHFSTGTNKVELNRALLRLVPSLEGRMIAGFDQELAIEPVELLGGEITTGFFRRLVQGMFTDGEFLETQLQDHMMGHPSLWREPLIFLRSRTAGLNSTLDYIVENLEGEGYSAPEGLMRIVGIEAGEQAFPLADGGSEELSRRSSGGEPDILFSKPANGEQYEIAARLTKSRAVLVQGPLGTGKTHTIANLLGYLLAQGKTVLVTAHTTKALRVLRRQIDDALQPLCLSLLDSDAESQEQLSRAAQAIADRLSRSDAPTLRREAGILRDKRQKLLTLAETLRRQLRDARFSEIDEIVLGGEGISPIEAAKRVKNDAEKDGWIPSALQPGILCPLDDADVRQLYSTQGALAPSDILQLSVSQPALERIVPAADFRSLTEERNSAAKRSQMHRPELWTERSEGKCSSSQLQQLHQCVTAAAVMLGEAQDWLREVLFAGWIGGGHYKAWDDLLDEISALAVEAGNAQRIVMAQGPELPDNWPTREVSGILNEIVAYLEGRGGLGLKTRITKRHWHRLIESCHIEGRVPQTLDEFRALQALTSLLENRSHFSAHWRRSVESLGGPTAESLGNRPEHAAQSYAAEVRTRLNWRIKVWEPLIEELGAVGFSGVSGNRNSNVVQRYRPPTYNSAFDRSKTNSANLRLGSSRMKHGPHNANVPSLVHSKR
jgi:AAA domain